jgi:hypothetical protein
MSLHRTIMQSNFDSVLDPSSRANAAKLTVALKVTLVPLDPAAGGSPPTRMQPGPALLVQNDASISKGNVLDSNGKPVMCKSWKIAEWNAFKAHFKSMVELTWNNQMIFLPIDDGDPRDVLSDEDYRQFVGNPGIRAHAEGAIRIALMPLGSVGHAVIEVAHRDNPAASFRDEMSRISDQSVFFRQHKDSRWPKSFFGQPSAAHEVGHWLTDLISPFFSHEDAGYAGALTARPGETPAQFGKRQDTEQYGHTLGKRVALMGAGSLVTEYDAGPWLARIRRHTRKLGWSYIHRVNFRHIASDLTLRQKRLTGRA